MNTIHSSLLSSVRGAARFAAAIAITCSLLGLERANAAAPASDDASAAAYNGGWSNASNGGSGFSAWTLSGGTNAGFYVNDSTQNGSGSSGGINTDPGNRSWFQFAFNGQIANAVRTFTSGGSNGAATLGEGESISLAFDNGFIDNGGVVGFSLRNASGTNRFEFYYEGGNAVNSYKINIAGTEHNLSPQIGFTADGFSKITFTQGASNSWTLEVTLNGGSTTTYTSASFEDLAASDIAQIRLFDFNSGNSGAGQSKNAAFNSLAIVTPPAVTTDAPVVTTTTATLKATVNPNGLETDVDFYVDSVYRGTVNDVSGTSAMLVTFEDSGYTPGTMHTVYAVATNAQGSKTGDTLNFTLLGGTPILTTSPVSLITSTSARLNGTVNPNGVDTNAYFYVDYDENGNNGAYYGPIFVPAGFAAVPISHDLAGIPGTMHKVKVYSDNAHFTGVLSANFETWTYLGGTPILTTSPVSLITSTTARLNGTVNPNGVDTSAYFYVDYDENGNNGTYYGPIFVPAGFAAVPISYDVTGTPGTMHKVKVYSDNAYFTGTLSANFETWTYLGGTPILNTLPVTDITLSSATLNGTVNPNGVDTSAYFYVDYDENGNNGSYYGPIFVPAGFAPVPISYPITGTPGTAHKVKVYCDNAYFTGILSANFQTWTYLGGAPTVTTLAPTVTSGTTATLRASVDPNLTDTVVYFYIDDVYVGTGLEVASGDDAVTVTFPATGLVENQTYDVRADAANTYFPTITGNTVSFTVTPLPPSALFTDWTSIGPGTQVNGTLPTPSGPVGITYEGDGAGADLNNTSTNFNRPETYTPPLVTSDSVATYGSPGIHHKLTFASPVSGIVMHWWSVGTPVVPVRLTFTKDGTTTPASFEIVSSGPNEYTTNGIFEREAAGNNVLHGEEGSGTIRFDGTFTTLEWDSDAYEVYFAFQVGAEVASQGVITDRFTLNGTTRVAGASVNGLQTETGGVTWAGRNAYVFTADGNLIVPLPTPPSGGVESRIMAVPYTPPAGEVVTVQGDIQPPYLNPEPGVWGAIGFSIDTSPPAYFDFGFYNAPVGQLWMLLAKDGGWAVIAAHNIILGSGTAPIFHADTFNRCRLTYNSATNTATATINGVEVMTNVSLGGFTPTIERAGFMFHRVDGGAFDNFAVIEGALPAPAAPAVTTGTVTNITTTSATLNATVYPGNLDTTVDFYLDGNLHGSTYVLPGNTAVPVSLPASGLTPGSSHSVHVVVTNSVDTATGNTVNFTLDGDAPVVTTTAATNITATTATLNATVNPNDFDTAVDFYLNTNLVGTVNVPAGGSPVPVSLPVVGLTGGTSYSCYASATNIVGTTTGNTVNFSTLSPFPQTEVSVTLLRSDLAPNGPDEALFALIRPPSLNAAGHIAFKGTSFVREATDLDPNPITTSNDMMIWADKGLSPLMLIAREGAEPPGLPGTLFFNFSDPIQSANDGVTFKALLKPAVGGVTSLNDEVFFSDLGGALTKIVRESDPISGAGSAAYKAFTSAAAVDGGVFGVATLKNGSSEIVNTNNDIVLWAWAPGDTQPLIRLREGDTITISASPLVSRTVKSFEVLTTKAGVAGQGRSFNNQPEVLVRASCTDGTVAYLKLSSDLAFLDKKEVVTAIIKGTSPVASSGPSEPASSTFATLETPAINSLGHRAFRGTVAQRKATVPPTLPAITAGDDAMIWADQGATPLAIIAREGDAAPGTSSTFLTFGDPIIADNDSVAFLGTIKSLAGINGTNNQGLWATTETGLKLVARKGSTLGGIPAAAVVNSIASVTVNHNGGAFTGKLRPGAGGVNANNDVYLAIWRKSDGAAIVALREGMWLEVSPGHPRALKSFDVFTPQAPFGGVGRSHNATGDMAVYCVFTDGTTGVFILNEEIALGGGGGGGLGGGGGGLGGGGIGIGGP